MNLTFKVMKNRRNTGSSNMFYSPTPVSIQPSGTPLVVKKAKYLEMHSYKHSKISKTFLGFYDSVPTVNTDTSLPISFDNIVCTFPNTRYSFYMYNSSAPMITKDKYYEDPYYNAIERSPYPYGYEDEVCFSKHTTIYGRGTNHIYDYIKETSKVIKTVPRKIVVSYIKASNTYIVTSKFTDDDETTYNSFTFFKQNEKLIFHKKQQILWNSKTQLPPAFAARVRKHLKENNQLLHQAIEVAPETVCQYRTVLNNVFWRKNSATYLLNSENKNARRRAQSAFKKNKVHEPLSVYNLPTPLECVLKDSYISLMSVPLLLTIYEAIDKKFGEVQAAKSIRDLIKLEQIHYGLTNFKIVGAYIDKFIALNFVDFSNDNASTIKVLFDYFREYPTVDVNNCNNISEYLQKLSLSLRTTLKPQKTVKLDIAGKVVILNPSMSEVIKAHIDTKFNYYSASNIHNLSYSAAIFNGKPLMNNTNMIVDSLSFSELLFNADLLVANNIITKKPEYKEEEVLVTDDFF